MPSRTFPDLDGLMLLKGRSKRGRECWCRFRRVCFLEGKGDVATSGVASRRQGVRCPGCQPEGGALQRSAKMQHGAFGMLPSIHFMHNRRWVQKATAPKISASQLTTSLAGTRASCPRLPRLLGQTREKKYSHASFDA